MGDLGRIYQLIIPVMGHDITFNLDAILMTWIVIAVLLIFGFYSTKNKSVRPGTVQVLGEMIVSQLYALTEDALDKEMAKKYAPLITALFMFLLLCNWIGMFPHMHEPTKDLNTPLSLGVMGFFIAHYAGIKSKGIKAYLKEYCEPIFLMAPLNIIGELSKIVYHSGGQLPGFQPGSAALADRVLRAIRGCYSGIRFYDVDRCIYFSAGKVSDD